MIVIFSSNKPEGVGGQVGDVSFSNNLCGSDLYIVYCLISNAVQLVLLAFALYNGAFLVPDVCLMTAYFRAFARAFCCLRSENQGTSLQCALPFVASSVQKRREASVVLLFQNVSYQNPEPL